MQKLIKPRMCMTIWVYYLFLFLMGSAMGVNAQENSWKIDVYASVHRGWWQYAGNTESGQYLSAGSLDYTQSSGSFAPGILIMKRIGRFYVGAGFEYEWINENELRKHQVASSVRDRYRVARGVISNGRIFAHLEYIFLRSESHAFGGFVRGGWWFTNIIHYNESDFDRFYFYGGGLSWNWDFARNFSTGIRTGYFTSQITSSSNERGHNWFNFGGEVTCSYKL